LKIAFLIILIHYIADFIFQDSEWAENKNKSFSALISHTLMYSVVWIFGAMFIFNSPCDYSAFGQCVDTIKAFRFVGITFVFHTITDYFTSKIVSKKFSKGEYGGPIPNFGAFSIIGLDQVLHYAQLFLTYQFLIV
jgi:hypothetical protein